MGKEEAIKILKAHLNELYKEWGQSMTLEDHSYWTGAINATEEALRIMQKVNFN